MERSLTAPRVDEAPAHARLIIERGDEGSRTVLVLRGELDLASAAQLGRELTDTATVSRSELLLDLGELEFIDCAGLRVLHQARARANATGQSLILRSVPARARRLLVILGEADAFVIE
jgi:anti-anti-sigma factor